MKNALTLNENDDSFENEGEFSVGPFNGKIRSKGSDDNGTSLVLAGGAIAICAVAVVLLLGGGGDK